MRTFWLIIATTCLGACGGTTASSSGTDAVITDSGSDALVDASADATATDASAGSDAVSNDADSSDGAGSPWTGKLFLNEIQAGGSKKPIVATDADWIELYNASSQAIDLSGCKVGGITNGIGGASALPSGTQVSASGFLVVYFNHASLGTPVIDAGIKSDGSMAIWDANGLQIDAVDWNEGDSPAGSTYDRTPDGAATWKTVSPPTPGAANSK